MVSPTCGCLPINCIDFSTSSLVITPISFLLIVVTGNNSIPSQIMICAQLAIVVDNCTLIGDFVINVANVSSSCILMISLLVTMPTSFHSSSIIGNLECPVACALILYSVNVISSKSTVVSSIGLTMSSTTKISLRIIWLYIALLIILATKYES